MFVGYEGYVAVVCGLMLAYCGYCIGKNNGFQAGIQACLVYMGDIGAIKVTNINGEDHITLPDNVKIDEATLKPKK